MKPAVTKFDNATNKALDKLVLEVNSKMTPDGAVRPVMTRGSSVVEPKYIPTSSFAVDYVLGTGGWFRGMMHEFFGAEHGGKTTLTMLALKDCFAYEGGKRGIALVDVEHRFNPEWARKMGLDIDNGFILVQPPNAEAATDAMHKLIKSGLVAAIGFDSIGAAAGWREQQEFDEQATMFGGNASIMARNVKTITPLASLYGTTCFYTNQLRADMEGFHRPMTPGGHAVKHMMSMRMYLRRGKEKYLDKRPEGDVQVGYPLIMKVIKNSFGPAPREQWSDFYIEPSRHLDHVGFDTDRELQRLGILTGVIRQKNSWYYLGEDDAPDLIKGNGRDAFYAAVEKAERMPELIERVRASLARGSAAVDVDRESEEFARPEATGPEIEDPET